MSSKLWESPATRDTTPPNCATWVGVDPAATSGEAANETGIIVAGIARDNQAYVLEDWSWRGSPDEWARKAVAAYRKHGADAIIAECNQGGEMVEAVIRSVAATKRNSVSVGSRTT